MASDTTPDHSTDTLAIDIGGTGLKASVLDATGNMEHERVRVDTPYPLSPQKLLLELQGLIAQLPPFGRVSVGFPGMVRKGTILSAPHFVSPDGPGGTPAPKLVKAWHQFDLAAALEEMTGRPTRVANDADLQGAAVIKGDGLELVVTLGTGVGTAMFYDGHLLPHLEFAHHPLRKGRTYNEVLGDAARRKAGNRKWAQRVAETVETLRALTFFDHCYIGGGNSVRLSDLPDDVTVVDNAAGILGGIKLWSVTETLGTATSPATPSSRPAPAARRTRRAPSGATTAKAPARKAAPAPARKAAGQPAVRKRAATGTARTTAAPATPAAPRRRRVSRPEGA